MKKQKVKETKCCNCNCNTDFFFCLILIQLPINHVIYRATVLMTSFDLCDKQFDGGCISVPQFLEYIQNLGIIVTPDARHEIRCNHTV